MFVVKVPGINGEKSEGCERAGNAIIESLREIYSNEQGILIDVDLLDLEEIHLDNSNLKLTNELIYKNSLETFETKPKTIFLGGDHSITYSIAKAFLDNCRNTKRESCLIVFDSHPDCKETKEKYPDNRQWLRKLIEDGFPKQNILLVGVRNSSREEITFLKQNNIRMITMNQLLEDLQDTCDIIMEFSSRKELYLSIDVDVIDPVFVPGTGNPEPGGLTNRQFVYLIQRINKVKNLKAIDIVEINAVKDKEGLSVKFGAKILSEFL
ncbi:MAG: arginase family protein [Nanoarchaeota archaeon]|nr:arginase family protein [Nanoarchaeota archaeon]